MSERRKSGLSYDDTMDKDGYIKCTSRHDGHRDHWNLLRFGLRAEAEKGRTLEEVLSGTTDENLRNVVGDMIARGVTLEELLAYDAEHLPHCVACMTTRRMHGEEGLPPLPAALPPRYAMQDPYGTRARIERDISGLR